MPRKVLVQEAALGYPLGRRLVDAFRAEGIEPSVFRERLPRLLPGKGFRERFLHAKRTLVVAVWRGRGFQTCRPSAHYQLPLVSGCPGLCEYCYLNTNLGRSPFVKVYVNTGDILERAAQYVGSRAPETTVFEGSATSDPVAVERWTGSLGEAIAFFAALEHARFRFVTKYADIDGILGIEHRGKTEVRFSVNCDRVLEEFEAGTPRLASRLAAARSALAADYPVGLLIGPIFVFDGWRDQYRALLARIADYLPRQAGLTFELITHRFTARAKRIIRDVYPGTLVPLDESERRFRYGQFGYGKYVYPEPVIAEIGAFFSAEIEAGFPRSRVLYIV